MNMKNILKYLLLLGLLLGVNAVSAQNAKFRSFRETRGLVTNKSKGAYAWGAWQQSSTSFSLNIAEKAIVVEDQLNKKSTKYEIFDKPDKWVVKKDYKYISFECMESSSLEKYIIQLYEYDSGEFRITVKSPSSAIRYSVIYVHESEESEEGDYDEVAADN
jgi:hypothetical protein